MSKVNLYLDNRAKKGNPAPLKIRIYQKGITKYVGTGLFILPEEWDKSQCMVMLMGKESMRINNDILRIREIIDEVLAATPRAFASDEAQVEFIKNHLEKRISSPSENFNVAEPKLDTSRLFLARMRAFRDSKQKAGTYEVYDRTIKALLAYDSNIETMTFEQVDYACLKAFEEHCEKKGMMVNTISIHMRNIRTVFNAALDDEITTAYPFRKYKIKSEETKKRSLTVQQFRELSSMKVETWHEEYRDLFLLSFLLIGINMTDLLSLRHSDLKDGRIEYFRAKTGTYYNIKVEPEAMAIIKRYEGKDYLLDPMDRYKTAKEYILHMDRALKQVGRETGKRGKILSPGRFPGLSSYWARHSWATFAYENGVSIDDIAQALGHKNREHRVTMIYIKQDTRRNDANNRKVIDYVSGRA